MNRVSDIAQNSFDTILIGFWVGGLTIGGLFHYLPFLVDKFSFDDYVWGMILIHIVIMVRMVGYKIIDPDQRTAIFPTVVILFLMVRLVGIFAGMYYVGYLVFGTSQLGLATIAIVSLSCYLFVPTVHIFITTYQEAINR